MRKLKQLLKKLIAKSKNRDLLAEKLTQNKFEYVFISLFHENIINFSEYSKIRSDFDRRNKFLKILKITAPTTFGQKWAQNHIKEICPQIKDPKELNIKSGSTFDLIYPLPKDKFIKIEIKAGRAVDKNLSELPYHERALDVRDTTNQFDMNFQQMKPSCFDIVIMIGVWSDKIRYWVMTSKEISNNKYFSTGQHRGNKGYEGQMHITSENIHDFKKFEVNANKIVRWIAASCSKK